MVVEDETTISQFVSRVLTENNTEVFVAPDGKAAQEMIERDHFDLCLIDIRIPAMSGRELYIWMMEQHPRMIKGVIFTTGDTMSNSIERFLEESDRPFIPKPFTMSELKMIVGKTINAMKADE